MPNMQDAVFAIYHAGGETRPVQGTQVAVDARLAMLEVDVALAEAVDAGLLERVAVNGGFGFRLTPAGSFYIQDLSSPLDDRTVRALLVGGLADGVLVHVTDPPNAIYSINIPLEEDDNIVPVAPGQEFPVMRFITHEYVFDPGALSADVDADTAYSFHATTTS
jgi:hypothetical protein